MPRLAFAACLALFSGACSPAGTPTTGDSTQPKLSAATPAGSPRSAGPSTGRITPESLAVVGDTALRLPDGRIIPTGFWSIGSIGRFTFEGREYAVIEGVECTDCDAPPTVLLLDLTMPPPTPRRDLPGWHPYPGRATLESTEQLVRESRLFWGFCDNGRSPGLVEFRTEYENGRPMPARVHTSESQARGGVVDRIQPRDAHGAATLPAVEAAVRAGRCAEVPPRELAEF